MPKINKKKLALLLDLEENQEQSSLLMLIDPEADLGQNLLLISRSFLASVLLDLGRMDKECLHCHALHWIDERQETSFFSNTSWE